MDVGVRISYRDAIALAAAVVSDPSTVTGAGLAGLVMPMSYEGVLGVLFAGGEKSLELVLRRGRGGSAGKSFDATEDEEREALSRMSSIFSR